jgi:hypothetical protein
VNAKAIAVVGLTGISYLATEQTLRDNVHSVEHHTENSLVVAFNTKDEGIRVFDNP